MVDEGFCKTNTKNKQNKQTNNKKKQKPTTTTRTTTTTTPTTTNIQVNWPPEEKELKETDFEQNIQQRGVPI